MTPNPRPRDGAIIRRDLWCLDADSCLTLAGRSGWPGLDCSECALAGQRREFGAPNRPALAIYRASDAVEGAAALPVADVVRPIVDPEPRVGTTSERAISVLRAAGRPMRTSEVGALAGIVAPEISNVLARLVGRGLARKLKHGIYEALSEPATDVPTTDRRRHRFADRLLEWARLCGAHWHIADAYRAFGGWSRTWVKNAVRHLMEHGDLRRVGYGRYEATHG